MDHITCRSKAVTLRGLPPKTVKSDGFELMKSIGDVKLADAAAAVAANVKVQPLESTAYLIYEQKAFRYYCEFAAVCVAMAMGPRTPALMDCEDSVDKVMRIIDEYKSQNAKVATANEGDLPGLAAKKVSWKMLCGVVKDTFKEIFDARAEKMGITRLLATTYDNAGAGDGGGPVPFNYDAAVGDPWAPLARRAVPVDWKPAKREPKAEARDDVAVVTPPRAPAVIDLRGDSDVEMIAAPAPAPPAPIEIDSDAAPSPIAVDADGAPWTCARCTYAENRPCFLCCEMCGGERA